LNESLGLENNGYLNIQIKSRPRNFAAKKYGTILVDLIQNFGDGGIFKEKQKRTSRNASMVVEPAIERKVITVVVGDIVE
jgi:hypothetical protein